MKKTIGILLLIFIYQFGHSQNQLTRIAFGSCSEEDTHEQMWPDICAQKPQLWIWLGDNVYADTHDMTLLRTQYQRQKSNSGYQQLLKICPVIGIWDDHDYGINDGGKFFTKKKESKEELLRFLDVPADAPVRQHEGAYTSYETGTEKQRVKVILLDTRYFRDTLYKSNEAGKRYEISKTGDVLGEEQWKWLERELKESTAAVNIIGSSIQFIAEEHGYEKWANFPAARQRLIKLLSTVKPKKTFFISGDRHIAEVSRMKIQELPYELYDFTSSGLTHTWKGAEAEVNKHRVGALIIEKTFGVIVIDWTGSTVALEIRGAHGALYQKLEMKFDK